MKRKNLFLFLFITTSLSAMDYKAGEKYGAKWDVTSIAELGEGVNDGKLVFMYPRIKSVITAKLTDLRYKEYYAAKRRDYEEAKRLYEEAQKLNQDLDQKMKKEQEDFLQGLDSRAVLEPGLAFLVSNEFGNNSYKIFFSDAKEGILEPFPCSKWPPKHSFDYKVSCNQRHEQKKVELKNGNLIIGENDAEISLSDLTKQPREIRDTITYGNRAGDNVAVLFSTGEILIVSLAENNKEPVFIDGKKEIAKWMNCWLKPRDDQIGGYRFPDDPNRTLARERHTRRKRELSVKQFILSLMVISIPLILLLRSKFARSIKYAGSGFLLAAAAYYVNFMINSDLLLK